MKRLFLFLLPLILFCKDIGAIEMSSNLDPKVIPITTKAPEKTKIYPIAIIGAGAAGTMAANRAVLNNNEVLLFAGAKKERKRSRGNWVRTVDNIPGLARYTRAVLELRNEVLSELTKSSLSQNLFVIEDSVLAIEKEKDFFRLIDGAGHEYRAQYVLLATGIMDEQPHIQGSIKPILKYANGQTVAYCLICDGHRSLGKKNVVIGYSKSAANVALVLAQKYPMQSLAILTNGHPPDFTPDLLKKLESKNIRIIESPILEVLGNKDLKQLTGFELESHEIIEADMGFVALGIRPNNQIALALGAEVDESGLVITDTAGESTVPNLFVIGDLRANSMKQIYTAWQHAVESIQLINKRIREQ